jgi:SAM-dependent methyltransferase
MKVSYELMDGIKRYAPGVGFERPDYNPQHFNALFELETRSFWFKSRNRLLKHLFAKYVGNVQARILEIGCGTGYVLAGLSEFEGYRLLGADLYIEGLKYAKQRLPHVEFVQLDFRQTPYENEFDAVGAFDILEHIDEDTRVIDLN